MCRLLGYLGPPRRLETLLTEPQHSLVVQSYQPQEMTAGLLNADGFGIGWYDPQRHPEPFTYKNLLPIWSDINLAPLSRYIESGCVLASIRSATTGQAVDLSNCQPFQRGRILGVHNGFVERFRATLYRPLRSLLKDELYQAIGGSTDSEHFFALFLNTLQTEPGMSWAGALASCLATVSDLAAQHDTRFAANLIFSDGDRLVASRYANRSPAPSLYWLRDEAAFPDGIVIASEPIIPGDWQALPENSILSVGRDCEIQYHSI